MAGSSYGDDASISGSVVINDGSSQLSDFRVETGTKEHALFIDASRDAIGLGTETPDGQFHIYSDAVPTTALGDPSAYQLFIQNASTSTGRSTGIAFGTSDNNVGASITYTDQGTYAVGDLHFYTKRSTTTQDDPEERIHIDSDGSVKTTVRSADTNVATRECARFTHLSDGSATHGFGTQISFGLENTNSEEVVAGGIGVAWATATDGSETSFMGFSTTQGGSTLSCGAWSGFGLTIHSDGYGSISGDAGTQALTVRHNRNADYAALFHNDGNAQYRYGVKIQCGTDDNSSTNYAVNIADGDGTAQGYITFSGGTVTYGPFTGVHDAAVQSSDFTSGSNSYDYGTIVKIISTSSPNLKKVSYVVAPTTSSEDKAVMGVYSGWAPFPDSPGVNNHQIFSLGDGHILVCNEGGDIAVGDYICSSNTQGHGMKQDSDQLYNYTVAKATEAVTWSNEDSNTKLISCTYHSA